MPERRKSFLKSVADTVWSYISPRKTQQRRDKPFKSNTKPLKDGRYYVPGINVNGQPVPTPKKLLKQGGVYTPVTPGTKYAVGQGRIYKPYDETKAPIVDPNYIEDDTLLGDDTLIEDDILESNSLIHGSEFSYTSASEDAEATEEELEGDTLVEDGLKETSDVDSSVAHIEASINQSRSYEYKRTITKKDKTIQHPEEDWDERRSRAFDYSLACRKRRADAQTMRNNGWSEDAIEVWVRIAMRGYEPLLPQNWLMDFQGLPTPLFATKTNQPYIRAINGKDFRAIKALRSLIDIGVHARDILHPSVKSHSFRKPEELIRREINAYSKWAFTDGGVNGHDNIPIFKCIACAKGVSADKLQAPMIKELGHLRAQWRERLRIMPSTEQDAEYSAESEGEEYEYPIPEVYGVVIQGLALAIVTYVDEGVKKPKLRILATFDYQCESWEVWTSLAIAILIVHCRNKMMEMKELKGSDESASSESSDNPDA